MAISFPFFTGPVVAPSPNVLQAGSYNVEPYLIFSAFQGAYDSDWTFQAQPTLLTFNPSVVAYIGLTSFMDLQVFPSFVYQKRSGVHDFGFNDLPIALDVQLYNSPPNTPVPSFKLVLMETFPTGRYNNLDPNKLATDSTGLGSYQTSIGLIFGQLHHLGSEHWLSYRLYSLYTIPSAVHVEGFNSYGGGFDTDGRVIPGQSLFLDLGLELALSTHVALALDATAQFWHRDHFSGNTGMAPSEVFTANPLRSTSSARVGAQSAAQFTLAPAIEYNWNEMWGIILGAWFTVAGRNTPQYVSGVFALNININ